jgi:hypothetical protein
VPATILIASQDHLDVLKARDDLAGATTFADTEALKALDAISRQKPGVVALERTFAATSRGAALINRIKADPSLTGCEIRIVSHDGEYSRVAARPPAPTSGGAATPAVAVAEPTAAAAAAAPLDQRGTRRAPRFKLVDGVEATIDGNTARLIDLSLVGAMVISPTVLKPNQRVRMSLGDNAKPMRFSASVAWASFELPPRYRAGIEFVDADPAAVGAFIEAKKKP